MPHISTTELDWQATKVNGIFSKNLTEYPEGTAKLILLKSGAAYPEHQHPKRTEYAYVLAGTPTLFDGESRKEYKVGDFITFPTDTLHSLANQSDSDAILFVGAIYHNE